MRARILLALVVTLAGCGSSGGGGAPPASATAPATTPSPTFRAGAARVDATTQIGAPLGGFGGGPRRIIDQYTIPINIAAAFGGYPKPNPAEYRTLFEPSVGTKDPIAAKALVLERDGERFAILSLDLIGVSRRAREEIARRVAPHGIAADHLLVCATHTHSGPGAVADKRFWEMAAMDMFDGRVFDRLTERCAQAVIDAVQRLEPARIGFAVEPETTVQRNRRGLGIVDEDLATLYVERPDGRPVALALNLAIHGICLDADNLEYSADLMGFCEREIEAQLGYGAVALFLNGAEGDVSPNHYGLAGAEAVGKAIAGHALALGRTAAAALQDDVPLAVAYEDFRFPNPPALRFDKLQGALGQLNLGVLQTIFGTAVLTFDESWFNRDIPAQAMRIGDVCLIAVPGEALTHVGLDLKARARALGFAHPLVVGLANDHLGYIASDVEYDKGGYEAAMTFFGRDQAAQMNDVLIRQVARIRP